MLNRKAFIGSAVAFAGALGAAGKDGKSGNRVSLKAEVPVSDEVDVLVVGGGPAGVCAAVSAAREGKRVFLAEETGAFGGAATAAGVPAFCRFGDGKRILVAGVGLEVRKMVSQEYPVSHDFVPLNAEDLKLAYDKVVTESGVRFSFFTKLCAVETEGRRMSAAVFVSKRGLFAVRAKVFVDATGDADLVAFGGGKYALGDAKGATMPATLCTLWGGIDFDRVSSFREQLEKVAQAVKDGHFTVPDLHLTGILKTPHAPKGVGGGNVGHVFGVDPTDERSLTRAMVDARSRMGEFESFYKKYLKGYDDLRLISTAGHLGVRESRRVTCDYTLTADDFLRRASFDDEIGRYSYPVDVHPSSADPKVYAEFERKFKKLYCYQPGESYGIPYRSLVPVSFDNVLVAGRCIGTDQAMQASVRVMPGCYITGRAAGVAAALAVATGAVRSIDMKALRARLTA